VVEKKIICTIQFQQKQRRLHNSIPAVTGVEKKTKLHYSVPAAVEKKSVVWEMDHPLGMW
jgi:hypothetical protein